MLRCAPEHIRAMTEEQEAALKFVTPDLRRLRGRFADRGAHTFTDMSREPKPDSSEVREDDRDDPASKRRRINGQEEIDVDIEDDMENDNEHH